MKDFLELLGELGIILGIGVVIILGVFTAGSYIVTGNPLTWTKGPNHCSSFIHIVDPDGGYNPVGNLAIKDAQASGTIATTNSTGYAHLDQCYRTVRFTYLGTDYAVNPVDGQTVEVQV